MDIKEKIEKEVVKAERTNLFALADGKNVTISLQGDQYPVQGVLTAPENSNEVMLFAGNKCVVMPHSAISKMSWKAEEAEETE